MRHAVVAGLLDAGDVGGGLAGLNAHGVVAVVVHDAVEAACGLGLDHLLDGLVVAGHEVEDVGVGGVSGNLVAPVGHDGVDGVALGVVAVGHAVVEDALHEAVLVVGPEGLLGLLVPLGEVLVVLAGCDEHVHQGVHAGAVLGHALDRHGEQGGGAIIGGVADHIQAEDVVVDGQGLAVGELEVVAQGDVVVDGAVGVLGDLDVGGAGVGVVGAVVLVGLALDALVDDLAQTGGGIEQKLRQVLGVLVICRLGKEGRELAAEVGVANDHRGVARACSSAAATATRQNAKCAGCAHGLQEVPTRDVHDASPFDDRIFSGGQGFVGSMPKIAQGLVYV